MAAHISWMLSRPKESNVYPPDLDYLRYPDATIYYITIVLPSGARHFIVKNSVSEGGVCTCVCAW